MNCVFDIEIDRVNHCQNVFKITIQDIIKGTGTFLIIGDLIVPLDCLEGEYNYAPREIFGRKFDPNKRLIIYEIG